MSIKNVSNNKKITYIIILLIIAFFMAIGIPTLARFNNRVIINGTKVWDGSISTSYKSGTGTQNDPYIISNGSELAYFSSMLDITDYENTYFKLSNDIILNNGVFNYDITNGISYKLNDSTYYVDSYKNTYYDNINRYGTEIGRVNIFNSINGFKGNFDGSSFRIYGLYVTSNTDNEVALFTNLNGSVSNLYVENSIIYGGNITAGIAGESSNSILKNIIFNGHVIGASSGLTRNITVTPTIDSINLSLIEQTNHINLSNNIPFIGSEIVSTSIKGNYTINDPNNSNTTIKINGVTVTGGSFEIDLAPTIMDSIPVVTRTDSASNISLTFSNLSYNITYKHTITSGIVALANNVTLDNVINKGYISGYSVVGGIIGTTINTTNLNKTYNTGSINAVNIASGLIGVIEKSTNNVSITKSYNTSLINGINTAGLIGILNNNTGITSITNSFNVGDNYNINEVTNSIVNIENSYYTNGVNSIKTGTVSEPFGNVTIDNLKDKPYMTNNLFLNEFINFTDLNTNAENVWVYEDGSYPILFIDDISNSDASININNYSWNNFSKEVSTIKLNSDISFGIIPTDNLTPLNDIKYYVSDSDIPLTEQEVNDIALPGQVGGNIRVWSNYTDLVNITSEGAHIIYAKVIDSDLNVSYMNSDVLFIDKTLPTGTISFNNNTFTDLRSTLNNIYINDAVNISIIGSDELSGISSIKYYISNSVLDISELNSLDDWLPYINEITLSDVGTYVIYAKVIDNCNNVTYINTDYILFDGYTNSNFTLGKNQNSYLNEERNITNKSLIKTTFTYNGVSKVYTTPQHNLKSNILLPNGSKITLIDHITSKVYEYKITTSEDLFNYNSSCVADITCEKTATYPFTLFKEVGSAIDKLYVENSYINNNSINEEFDIILDLTDTTISNNYSNIKLYLELKDSSNVVRPTLSDSLKTFNIYYNNVAASTYLNTDYDLTPININSNSTTSININTGITYKYENGKKIIDTSYENKTIGLSLMIVDSSGNVVNRNYLRNIKFKIGNNEYYMGTDNIVRINLKSGINNITKVLDIITGEHNITLPNGTYYLKINNYTSYDGYYYNSLNTDLITIPVVLTNSRYSENYGFDVLMNNENRIINKVDASINLSFNILVKTTNMNPSVKVKLLKKDDFSPYNQDYSIVDLKTYVSNDLDISGNNIYNAIADVIQYNGTVDTYNAFNLTLIPNNFLNTSYKLVFELYDGVKKVDSVEKTFIVR